jgi:hypothetical protein
MVLACLDIHIFSIIHGRSRGKSRDGSFYFNIDLLEIKLSIFTKNMLEYRVARPRPEHALPF